MHLENIIKQCNNGHISEENKKVLLGYIDTHESVLDESLFFIKRLTKAAAIILNEDAKCLEPYLEKIFVYHGEGVQKAEELGVKANSSSRIKTLKSHLLGHNNQFCMALYRQTDDVFWAKEACWQKEQAIKMIIEIADLSHLFFSWMELGASSLVVYDHTGDLNYAEKSYSAYQKSMKYVEKSSQKISSLRGLSGLVNLVLNDLDDDYHLLQQWGKRSFDIHLNLADISGMKYEKDNAFLDAIDNLNHQLKTISKNNLSSKKLYNLIDKLYLQGKEIIKFVDDGGSLFGDVQKFMGDALKLKGDVCETTGLHYLTAMNCYNDDDDLENAAECALLSTKIWQKLYFCERKKIFGEKWYEAQLVYTECEQKDSSRAVGMYYLGAIASLLSKQEKNGTRKILLERSAKKAYKHFISFFINHEKNDFINQKLNLANKYLRYERKNRGYK